MCETPLLESFPILPLHHTVHSLHQHAPLLLCLLLTADDLIISPMPGELEQLTNSEGCQAKDVIAPNREVCMVSKQHNTWPQWNTETYSFVKMSSVKICFLFPLANLKLSSQGEHRAASQLGRQTRRVICSPCGPTVCLLTAEVRGQTRGLISETGKFLVQLQILALSTSLLFARSHWGFTILFMMTWARASHSLRYLFIYSVIVECPSQPRIQFHPEWGGFRKAQRNGFKTHTPTHNTDVHVCKHTNAAWIKNGIHRWTHWHAFFGHMRSLINAYVSPVNVGFL